MNKLIRKHSDLSNSIIKKGQSYFQSSGNSKSDTKLTFMTLCFLGHLTQLGDALLMIYFVPLCDTNIHFKIKFRVVTDGYEVVSTASKAKTDETHVAPGGIAGFLLKYEQKTCA